MSSNQNEIKSWVMHVVSRDHWDCGERNWFLVPLEQKGDFQIQNSRRYNYLLTKSIPSASVPNDNGFFDFESAVLNLCDLLPSSTSESYSKFVSLQYVYNIGHYLNLIHFIQSLDKRGGGEGTDGHLGRKQNVRLWGLVWKVIGRGQSNK